MAFDKNEIQNDDRRFIRITIDIPVLPPSKNGRKASLTDVDSATHAAFAAAKTTLINCYPTYTFGDDPKPSATWEYVYSYGERTITG